jgi:D-xylose transport system substrate-binding protein
VFSALLRSRRLIVAAVSVLALAVAVGACGTSNKKSSSSGGGGGSSKSGAIGLLLPETKTTRYEAFDHPYFQAKLKAICPSCKLLYANSNQDASQQQSQAESMLTQGAKVLVLDPVDGKAAQAIVAKAKSQNVPVVSYDRLASGQFKKGAHSALDGKVTIGKEFDTPDWSPDKAQTEADQAITSLGKNKIIGFYSANDGMAAGIAASINNAGFNPFPPLTGQDAQLDAIQRILAGKQTMTVYKAIKPEAEAAAQMAVDLLQGKKYANASRKVDNGTLSVPSQLLTPVEVTSSNIKDTVVKDGFYTVKQICTPKYAAACKKAGLQ